MGLSSPAKNVPLTASCKDWSTGGGTTNNAEGSSALSVYDLHRAVGTERVTSTKRSKSFLGRAPWHFKLIVCAQ